MTKSCKHRRRPEPAIGIRRTSSFYGVCRRDAIALHSDIAFDVPMNDTYGQHLRFEYEKD